MPVCVGARAGGGGGGGLAGRGGGAVGSHHWWVPGPAVPFAAGRPCALGPVAAVIAPLLGCCRRVGGGGGGGMSGHTMARCLALLFRARLGVGGGLRLSSFQSVPHPGTSRQAQRWVSDTLLLRAVVAQSPVMGYAGPYLEPIWVQAAEFA